MSYMNFLDLINKGYKLFLLGDKIIDF